MTYQKAPLRLPELVDHLASIGLAGSRSVVEQRIRDVGYYRLSPYWRFFRRDPQRLDSQLLPNTSIHQVWRLYTFDRELRLLALDALERVEIAIRSRLVQYHVRDHGPFGYAEGAVGEQAGRASSHYRRLLQRTEAELAHIKQWGPRKRTSEAMRHFATKYGPAHDHPPLWLAAEDFSFGDLVTLYRGSPNDVRKQVAKDFQQPAPVFESWLMTLQTMRNVCAHHGRLWNRAFGVKPKVPRQRPEWAESQVCAANRPFYLFTVIAAWVGIVCDGSHWPHRFKDLLARYPEVPRAPIGVPERWESHTVWSERLAMA